MKDRLIAWTPLIMLLAIFLMGSVIVGGGGVIVIKGSPSGNLAEVDGSGNMKVALGVDANAIIKGSPSGNLAEVDASNNLKVALGTDATALIKGGTSGVNVDVDAANEALYVNTLALKASDDSVKAVAEKAAAANTEGETSCSATSALILASFATRIMAEFTIVSGAGIVYLCTFTPCTAAGAGVAISTNGPAPPAWDTIRYTGNIYCITDGSSITVKKVEL